MWLVRVNGLPIQHKIVIVSGAVASILVTIWLMTPLPRSAATPIVHPASVARPSLASAFLANSSTGPTASIPPLPQAFEPITAQQAEAINAETPFSALPNPAAKPFELPTANSTDRPLALTCLTMAIYYEAASQSDQGQAAVAQVVLNRLRNPLFPKTICGVVFQGSTLPTGCQFTFTCDGSLKRRPSETGWDRARRIAQRALDGYVEKSVGEATHYHTVWVVPYWQSSVIKVAQIGAHIFYRWDGALGTPAAFRGQYAGVEPSPAPIAGFDADPSVAAGADTAATPAAAEVAVLPPPATVALSKPVVQVAMLHFPVAPLAQIEPPNAARTFYGDDHASNQHLPVPSRW
jgi:spore germination cell wall hydrolase CwlJ-like protein